jgi:cellulose synthase/poly-beta-1,6-N-acetylglucosamine synthase-like glycosyltransferase
MVEVSFWIAVGLLIYPYVIYPICAWALAKVVHRRVRKSEYLPTVTVVTAAFNEVKVISANIANKLAQDYPADKLRMLVVSDASTDGTDEAVATLAAADARVSLLRQEPRAGKTAALNRAITASESDIIVFADANSMYDTQALRQLLRNFADPEVGYVTGRMTYVGEKGSVAGEGSSSFMGYENTLCAIETSLGSIVGADGGVDAVRRKLYRPMRPDQLPDFVLPLDVVRQGYRAVFEPDALLQEHALVDAGSEYRMRTRVALRAYWALWDMRSLLLPWRSGLFAWQLWSHKVLRYLSFLPLLLATACAVSLAPSNRYFLTVCALGLLAGSIILLGGDRGGASVPARLLRLAHYFLLLNIASAVAFWRFLRGEKQVVWQPRVG